MFQLHKFLLITRSKKFEMAFKATDLQKNFEAKNLTPVSRKRIQTLELKIESKLKCVTENELLELFDKLLLWIYSGDISFPEHHNLVFELLLLADEYFLEDLKRKCEENLEFYLGLESVTDLLILCSKYKSTVSESFQELCIQSFVDLFHKLEDLDKGIVFRLYTYL